MLWLKIAKSGSLRERSDEKQLSQYKLLLDSGSSSSIVSTKLADYSIQVDGTAKVQWSTVQGSFSTKKQAKLIFSLPAFSSSKKIQYNFHVAKNDTLLGYDIIAGIDFLTALGVQLDFKARTITWDQVTVEMQEGIPAKNAEPQKLFLVREPTRAHEATKRMLRITDAQYEVGSVGTLCEAQTHLKTMEKSALHTLLHKFPQLFDGKLGAMIGPPVSIEIKKGEEPVNLRPYPIPVKRKAVFLKEINRLIDIGVLRREEVHNASEWASPSFIIPKKDESVRFLSDFRKLNAKIVRKPYPIPKILELMQTLEGFTYATTLDLNMGYYTIKLDKSTQKICTIVTPVGKYTYLRLPMGINCAPDIFQAKMNNLMSGLEYVKTYFDDLLILSNGNFEDHLSKVGTVLQRLSSAGLKVHRKNQYLATRALIT